mmetsp:Transcript_2657/g.6633  ORF Transcript_2657/g.6633 Transcript_2657/m.6633 type:complete len:384 (-) Transcript_2657:151-1302(-)
MIIILLAHVPLNLFKSARTRCIVGKRKYTSIENTNAKERKDPPRNNLGQEQRIHALLTPEHTHGRRPPHLALCGADGDTDEARHHNDGRRAELDGESSRGGDLRHAVSQTDDELVPVHGQPQDDSRASQCQYPLLHGRLGRHASVLVDAEYGGEGSDGVGDVVGAVREGEEARREDLEVGEHFLGLGIEVLAGVPHLFGIFGDFECFGLDIAIDGGISQLLHALPHGTLHTLRNAHGRIFRLGHFLIDTFLVIVRIVVLPILEQSFHGRLLLLLLGIHLMFLVATVVLDLLPPLDIGGDIIVLLIELRGDPPIQPRPGNKVKHHGQHCRNTECHRKLERQPPFLDLGIILPGLVEYHEQVQSHRQKDCRGIDGNGTLVGFGGT